MCCGFWVVEVPPSPKVHAHEVGLPALVSVNWTVRGARPAVGVAVKAVTGGAAVSCSPEKVMAAGGAAL